MIPHIISGLACHLSSCFIWDCDCKDDEKDVSGKILIWTEKAFLHKHIQKIEMWVENESFSTAGCWLPISDVESKLGFLGAGDKKAISRFSMISWQLGYFGDFKSAHQQIQPYCILPSNIVGTKQFSEAISQNCTIYSSKFQNVFVQIAECICPDCRMYF